MAHVSALWYKAPSPTVSRGSTSCNGRPTPSTKPLTHTLGHLEHQFLLCSRPAHYRLAVQAGTSTFEVCDFCFTYYLFSFLQPPPPSPELPQQVNGRIAVIGAGLTGVSSAAHAIAHGFDVVIYEQTDEVGA